MKHTDEIKVHAWIDKLQAKGKNAFATALAEPKDRKSSVKKSEPLLAFFILAITLLSTLCMLNLVLFCRKYT